MQVLGFHFVKNAKNKEILHVTGSNPVQYVRTATSMYQRGLFYFFELI